MARRLSIVLGAATSDSVKALVVAQGFGAEFPLASVRRCGSSVASILSLKPMQPEAAIGPALRERAVSLFTLKAPLAAESVIEVHDQARSVVRQTRPLLPLPAKLSDLPGGLTFVLASCTYYWPPYLQLIAERFRSSYGLGPAPRFVVLAGDNIYLDLPKPDNQRPADVVDRYLKYYLDEGYGSARAALPAFSTFDDHEYWNDFPELALPVSAWLTERERPGFEAAARASLELFQRSINPRPIEGARHTYRIDVPPLSICVIDTRTDRSSASAPRPVLMRDAELDALVNWTRSLQGPGILVLGQPLWIEPTIRVLSAVGDHNVSFFAEQYGRICRALEEAPYDVLVCSGDVHYSRLLEITTRERRVLHEVAASPLVSIPPSLKTGLQYIFGGRPSPLLEQGIADTARAPRAGWHASYQMGTGCGTTFAVLNVRPAGNRLDVGLAFIDLRTGQPAELVRATPLGRAPDHLSRCFHMSALSLGPALRSNP